MTSYVQSLLRGLTILDVLADAPDGLAGLADIAQRAGLSPSTTHRLLTTLAECGYVGREPGTKEYVIGHRMVHFSSTVRRRTSGLRHMARSHLELITAETGETCNLVVLDGKNVVYIDQVEGTRALRMVPGVGSIFPAYTSASAKAILAYQVDKGYLDAVFSMELLIKRAAHTLTDKCEFEAALGEVVKRGFAVEEDELTEGASCLAAPIRGRNGVAIGAISVPGPTGRVLDPSPDRLGALVKKHALQVSAALGFRQLSHAAAV
ncbi:IclR family transcriptional regulator [Paraburkholderia sp. BL10I2N1]|uniref:IclR family transcriptional regulator n=1 Tax=Paraburkholderia sp. BL10I2N1 TaxID=1938796 RepID=UPI00105BEA46|nr:IclR family transcriptional regulator [Paraburkholderia sp. BL10I2N1]TDN58707.1 IclR family transcriptional regulator [Paraburkholderia sp. BL10I2N1]